MVVVVDEVWIVGECWCVEMCDELCELLVVVDCEENWYGGCVVVVVWCDVWVCVVVVFWYVI